MLSLPIWSSQVTRPSESVTAIFQRLDVEFLFFCIKMLLFRLGKYFAGEEEKKAAGSFMRDQSVTWPLRKLSKQPTTATTATTQSNNNDNSDATCGRILIYRPCPISISNNRPQLSSHYGHIYQVTDDFYQFYEHRRCGLFLAAFQLPSIITGR